jgi:hypothetical protein
MQPLLSSADQIVAVGVIRRATASLGQMAGLDLTVTRSRSLTAVEKTPPVGSH